MNSYRMATSLAVGRSRRQSIGRPMVVRPKEPSGIENRLADERRTIEVVEERECAANSGPVTAVARSLCIRHRE